MDWTENLKKLMQEKGFKISELSDRIKKSGSGKVSRNTIANILSGSNSPKVETLQLIADALGVEFRQIFTAPGDELTGFLEYQGQVFRVGSLSELENLVYEIKIKKNR